MDLNLNHTLDSVKETANEVAEVAQTKTSEFHENYVSKVVPDCGKYADEAKFVAEMVPGVSEYNCIREGDWQGFAISAGIDVAAVAAGAFSAGAGYAVVKGGSGVAKAGVKVAVKEVAEAGAKTAVKEVAETGAKKAVKEVAEAGAEKVVKEVVETGTEKAVKEVVETGAEKAVKDVVETEAEKTVKEVVEEGAENTVKKVVDKSAENAVKEVAETGTEEAAREVVEEGAEKAAKEVVEEGTENTVKEVAEEGTEKAAKEVAEKTSLEVGEKIDKTLISDYVDDIEKITGRELPSNQKELLEKALKENDFTKLSTDATITARKEFNSMRADLIHEWEVQTGQEWPRYAENVLDEAGKVIKKAGQPYDVHHIIELSTSGPNEWWNLQPASVIEHKAIHAADSLASKIFR